jgi:hypothetical protein
MPGNVIPFRVQPHRKSVQRDAWADDIRRAHKLAVDEANRSFRGAVNAADRARDAAMGEIRRSPLLA